MANQPRFAHFSLDDVYRSRAYREELATETHPLFITRGPLAHTSPVCNARSTRSALAVTAFGGSIRRPYERHKGEWPLYTGPAEAVIDGWCLSAARLATCDADECA
jgi:D-glycerate 3-kinase